MKKILVTRKLLKDCEDKATKTFEAKLNSNDEIGRAHVRTPVTA